MKKGLRVILTAALTALPVCGFANNDNEVYHETVIAGTHLNKPGKHYDGWVNGDMPCPKSTTVYSQAVDLSVPGNKGFIKSDQSYTAYNNRYFHVKSYSQFTNNIHPIGGVLVYGVFINSRYTFQYDEATERLNLDADGKMSKPLRMGVLFCKDNNGYPGEVIYKEEKDIYGTKSDGIAGDKGKGDEEVPIYAFQFDLNEKVKLEKGWVCIYACDTGEKQNTAFAIVSDSSEKGAGLSCLEYEGQTGEIWSNSGSYNFCLTGNPNEYLANKGLKFTRVLSPDMSERSKYGKVQVEVWNYGATPITDATFALYEGSNKLAEETVPETILSDTKYKYTFKTRIDCSATGTHHFSIENNTPGDEQFSDKTIAFDTQNTGGEQCDSRSNYNGAYKYITRVKCGNIDNSSSWSLYSDYTNQSTNIAPGETLTVSVERKAASGDYIKVFVDWNGDGLFDGPGELVGYVSGQSLDFTIPSNATVKPGKRTMRILLTDHDGAPCGTYSYGETEDYTLNVIRPENSPAMTIDKDEVVFADEVNTNDKQTLNVKNEGDAQLNAKYDIVYSLPFSPATTPIYRSPEKDSPVKLNAAPAKAPAKAPVATEDDPFAMTYAGDYKANVGIGTSTARFAHYFPASATSAVKGMKISSIDIYVATPAETKSSVCIWKGYKGVQNAHTETLYTQEFTPVADSWNHVVLKTPYTIGDDDILVGMELEGCAANSLVAGTDNGPANVGFGDLFSYVGYNAWYSLADYGYDTNILIRANVTGTRTPAVSWLSIDKDGADIAAGNADKLTVTAYPWGLEQTVYDAAVKFTTNDPLATEVKVPVYFDLTSGLVNGIKLISANAGRSKLHVTPEGRITLDTEKHVSYIALFTSDGRQLQMNFDTNFVDASALSRGVYVVKAVLDDETTVSGTVAVK